MDIKLKEKMIEVVEQNMEELTSIRRKGKRAADKNHGGARL